MKEIKYLDVETDLCDLQNVLCDSLVCDKLSIACVNHECDKFCEIVKKRPKLEKASYVIFSKNMLDYHDNEIFVFIDEHGSTVDFVSGRDFWLYDMIDRCEIIHEDEYQ